MSKITFTYKDREYELGYTRKTVKAMEANGFDIKSITESTSPVTMITELFSGAFLANHKYVKRELIDEIYDSLAAKQDIIAALIEMYMEAVNSLFEEVGDEGNATIWTKG